MSTEDVAKWLSYIYLSLTKFATVALKPLLLNPQTSSETEKSRTADPSPFGVTPQSVNQSLLVLLRLMQSFNLFKSLKSPVYAMASLIPKVISESFPNMVILSRLMPLPSPPTGGLRVPILTSQQPSEKMPQAIAGTTQGPPDNVLPENKGRYVSEKKDSDLLPRKDAIGVTDREQKPSGKLVSHKHIMSDKNQSSLPLDSSAFEISRSWEIHPMRIVGALQSALGTYFTKSSSGYSLLSAQRLGKLSNVIIPSSMPLPSLSRKHDTIFLPLHEYVLPDSSYLRSRGSSARSKLSTEQEIAKPFVSTSQGKENIPRTAGGAMVSHVSGILSHIAGTMTNLLLYQSSNYVSRIPAPILSSPPGHDRSQKKGDTRNNILDKNETEGISNTLSPPSPSNSQITSGNIISQKPLFKLGDSKAPFHFNPLETVQLLILSSSRMAERTRRLVTQNIMPIYLNMGRDRSHRESIAHSPTTGAIPDDSLERRIQMDSQSEKTMQIDTLDSLTKQQVTTKTPIALGEPMADKRSSHPIMRNLLASYSDYMLNRLFSKKETSGLSALALLTNLQQRPLTSAPRKRYSETSRKFIDSSPELRRMQDGSVDLPLVSQLQAILTSHVKQSTGNVTLNSLSTLSHEGYRSVVRPNFSRPTISQNRFYDDAMTRDNHASTNAGRALVNVNDHEPLRSIRSNKHPSTRQDGQYYDGNTVSTENRDRVDEFTSQRNLRKKIEQIFQEELRRYGL